MEEILKTFSIGFLLRSFVAGGFFLLALQVATRTREELRNINFGGSLSIGLLFCVFAGITAYSVHRCVLFPVIEWLFNRDCAKEARKGRWAFISDNTVDSILRNWQLGEDNEKKCSTQST